MTVARVLPNVTGLDKHFDYLVPADLDGSIALGDIVRVDLHGRRVGGWVLELDPPDAVTRDLKPIAKRTGHGPSPELIELAEWASVRWVARRRHFLTAASPERAIAAIPGAHRTGRVVEPRSPASTRMLDDGGGVLRLPPASDPKPAMMSAAARGPVLVIVPGADQATLIGAAIRRAGLTVAVMPNDWSQAAAGVDVVIGARAAAWAPCPGIASIVVIDEHDEGLQEEGTPTWHARDVAVERGRRAGAPVLLVSPCPTLTALEWKQVVRPPHDRERNGWPIVEIVDRTGDEPWKRSLVTSPLITHLRDLDRTVVCVSNTPGRARLLACRNCRQLARCERCEAAVVQPDDGRLVCPRCGTERPSVCTHCGAGRFANIRPGVSRLVEEIEAAANRPAVLVTGDSDQTPGAAGVYVGTEAVLHRVERADTVVFLDFDRELLAPRYRAGEQAMAMLVRAARLTGPRGRGGRILIQTFLPDHPVLRAAVRSDPGLLVDDERSRRQMLQLPPYAALAEVSGAGSDEFVASLPPDVAVTVAGADEHYVARAADWTTLGEHLGQGVRPPGARLRIAVDPPRA